MDINQEDNHGHSALIYACWKSNYKIVEYLLSQGAKIDKKSSYYAVMGGGKKIVELFIKKGMNVNDEDVYGHSLLFYATTHRLYEIIDLLIKNGADINVVEHGVQGMKNFLKNFYKEGKIKTRIE